MKVKFYLTLLFLICSSALYAQTISYIDEFQLTTVTFVKDASLTDGRPSYTGTGKATDGNTYTYRLRWCSIYNPQQGKTTGAWILGSDQDANVECNSGNPYWINQSNTLAPPPTSGTNDGWFYPLNETGGNTSLVLSGSGLLGLATINTTTATPLATSFTAGGSYVYDGGQAITDEGIVYGTSANPTTSNGKVSAGSTEGTFSATTPSTLTPSTTYHYRSYAINASGTAYGTDQTVKTLTPTITSNITTVTMPGTTYGTASANGSFTVSGAGMAAGILVTPTSAFEVSLSQNSGFGSSVTVGTAGATIAATIVYIRLKSTDPANTYSGSVTLSSTSATSQFITESATTVSPEPITITAIAASKTYGDADPALTYSTTSGALFNGDSFTGSLTRDAGSNAGTYNITQGTVALSTNYALTFVSKLLTIGQRPVTITATAATKQYGDTDPNFTYNITSGTLATGDSFTGTLSRASGEIPGTYATSQGTVKPVNASSVDETNNYNVTFVSNNLTITNRLITIHPQPATKVYGSADPNLPYNITGTLPPNEGMTGTFGRVAGENVGAYQLNLGTKHPVNASTGVSTALYYTITFIPDNLTITKVNQYVSVRPATKTYGDADPAYQLDYSPLLPFGDTYSGALTRAPGENAGTYNITQGTFALNSNNYNLVGFAGSTLTISPKTIFVTANAKSKTYGDADPVLTYTADALVGTDSFAGALTRDAGTAVGSYAIKQGSLILSSNYSINFTGSTLTIGAKTINITANAQTKNYGDADPALTYIADALVSGDSFTGALSRATGETPGIYAISQGSLALSTNYSLNYTGANLTITPHTNADLANLNFNNATLSPSFSSGTLTYTASVIAGITSETVTPTLSDATATVTINGTPVTSSVTIPLSVGDNIITTKVTAQDGTTTKTYTTTVTRAVPDLNFTYFTANGNDLQPGFDNSITSYTSAMTGYPLATFDFALEDPTGTITVNGTAIPSGQTYANVPLTVGSNPVSIVVTAQDPTFTKTTNVTVNYSISNVAQLDALQDNLGGFDQTFDPAVTSYTQTVAYGASAIVFTPYSSQYGSVIKVNGTAVGSNTQSNPLPLALGDNTFTIVVTAQDGVTTKTYTVDITRTTSNDAYLDNLTISGHPLDIPFGYTGDNSYTATVASSVSTIQVEAVTEDTTARVTIDGTPVASGSLSGNIALSPGQNTIPVVVTAQDGVTIHNFTITVTRLKSTNDKLSNLTLSIGTLNPAFNSDSTTYNVTVPNGTHTVTFTPTAADPSSTITIFGTTVPSGTPSDQFINAIEGTNSIPVVVTAQDGVTTQTYYVNVTPVPSDAKLSAITLSSGTLSPAFNADSINYNVAVDYATTSISVTATTHDPQATVSVNGGRGTVSTKTKAVSIRVGRSSIGIAVRSADNTNQIAYFLNFIRPATLSGLSASAGALGSAFDPLTTGYTVTVPNATSSTTITPASADATTTITVNGNVVQSGVPSGNITLAIGNNNIPVVVTAADGSTMQTYTVNVYRTPGVATLAGLTFSTNTVRTSSPVGPGFRNYATTVNAGTSNFTVKPVATDPLSTITVNGTVVASGTSSGIIPLPTPSTVVTIVVTAQDGITSNTYYLTVNTTGSSNALLSSLNVTPHTALARTTTTGNTISYNATVPIATTSIMVTPTIADAGAIITMGGVPITSGSLSDPITLNASGPTVISLLVTAADGITTENYVINVIKAPSSNDNLKALAISTRTLLNIVSNSPTDVEYTTSVDYNATSLTVTPTTSDSTATVTVNGTPVTSATASGAIALNTTPGTPTVVSIVVTAQDGVSKRAYNINVNRTGSSNALLSGLSISPRTPLIVTTTGASPVFSATVPAGTPSVTVTPTTFDAYATVTVNSSLVSSGRASGAIILSTGNNVINLVVTAQDGVTTKTYTINVTDPPVVHAVNGPTWVIGGLSTPLQPAVIGDVVVHEAVSPNGDGINDVLTIDGITTHPDNSLSIMNTDGSVVYAAKGYDNTSKVFDGHDKHGNMQKPGTYFYLLQYKEGDQTKQKTGYIILKY